MIYLQFLTVLAWAIALYFFSRITNNQLKLQELFFKRLNALDDRVKKLEDERAQQLTHRN